MSQEKQSLTAEQLLRQTRVEVAPETFFLISLSFQEWLKLLENPELSPRGTAPFMLLRDMQEVTILLDEIDYDTIRHAIRNAKTEGAFRLLTFNLELGWNVVGYFALIAQILAEAKIPIGAISAFSRDHLLIKQEDLPKALQVLSEYVEELC
jgi:hypothetical protein